MSRYEKEERLLEIFFRCIRGEKLYTKRLAEEYKVSTRSISRDIDVLKNFLVDHRDLVGYSELQYDYKNKCHKMIFDELLQSNELFAIIEVLIGSRAFATSDLLNIIQKMKRFVTKADETILNEMIRKEVYQYCEIKHDSACIIDTIWKVENAIFSKNEITITYYKMDRSEVHRRIRSQSILFSEYYFYLVAYQCTDENYIPIYYRIDRITNIIIHRDKFLIPSGKSFDEGDLKKKIQFMWPGKEIKVKFEFSGPSVQAILDRIPTARIIDEKGKVRVIEAVVYGEGIKMFLLSQGKWVKVLEPESLVHEMQEELRNMMANYI
ncbi:MAG: hypothetical protein K0S41_3351 [Anaerocolumna sp.]|nr:hypothetical protein [Anaerocolumna sp.]